MTLTKQYIRPRLILLTGRVDPKKAAPPIRRAYLRLNEVLAWSMLLDNNCHISILRGHAADIMTIAATMPMSSQSRMEVEQMVLEANTREIGAMMQEVFNRELS